MHKLPSLTSQEVVRILERKGFVLDKAKGSHRQYKHPNKKGLVTISGHLRDDLVKGTLNSILKQSGLKEEIEDGEIHYYYREGRG